ncbi:MAG: DNA gyrase C-terminal beta-propeller domain-containing protein, partial [Anaerolineales bacterium]
ANGMVMRMKVKEIKKAGRATRGSHMMGVKEGDRVVSIARTATAELKRAGVKTNGEAAPDPGAQFEMPLK